MKNLRYIVFCVCACVALCAAAEAPTTGTVKNVVDGVTIELESGETVRYIGVSDQAVFHPAYSEVFEKQAAEANRKLVLGKKVRLEYDILPQDREGRLLAYVYLDDVCVNAQLVKSGAVQAVATPPNLKNIDLFMKMQIEAQKSQTGIWGTPTPSAGGMPAAPAPAVSPGAAAKQPQIVWVSRSGNKYHRQGCGKLDRGPSPMPVDKAKEAGYSPCLMCNPPQ